MTEPSIAKKYAVALFNAASTAGKLDAVHRDLNDLVRYFDSDHTLEEFLQAPHVIDEQKYTLVRKAFGGKVVALLFDFICLLLKKHRFNYLKPIALKFEELMEEEQGVLRAQITTAIKLDSELLDQLKAKLEARTQKTIKLIPKVDPGILGGIIVILKHKIIDKSIRQELTELRGRLLTVKVY